MCIDVYNRVFLCTIVYNIRSVVMIGEGGSTLALQLGHRRSDDLEIYLIRFIKSNTHYSIFRDEICIKIISQIPHLDP